MANASQLVNSAEPTDPPVACAYHSGRRPYEQPACPLGCHRRSHVALSVRKGDAQTQEKPIVQIPQPGVPQIMTLEGKFVRVGTTTKVT